LTPIDLAIAKAITEDIFIDEINASSRNIKHLRAHRSCPPKNVANVIAELVINYLFTNSHSSVPSRRPPIQAYGCLKHTVDDAIKRCFTT
jgi:hypothetical protein